MFEFLLFVSLAIIFLISRLARPVMADLKCGDAPPTLFDRDGLVIAWTGPVPENAKVSIVGSEAFDRASGQIGSSVPDGLARRYTEGRLESDVFNASTAWDIEEAARWHERYGMKLGQRPRELFEEYLQTGRYVIFQALVDHPTVPDFEQFAVCSVAFQRGDIYMLQGREHLFLQSYLHSHRADDRDDFVNFGPSGGIRISFTTDSLWYPLRVTKLNGEPTSVVLNVFTEDPLDVKDVPDGFAVETRGWMRTELGRYAFSRLTASFEGGQDVPDLSLRM